LKTVLPKADFVIEGYVAPVACQRAAGTSSVGHLRENLAAAKLTLSAETLAELDGIAAARS